MEIDAPTHTPLSNPNDIKVMIAFQLPEPQVDRANWTDGPSVDGLGNPRIYHLSNANYSLIHGSWKTKKSNPPWNFINSWLFVINPGSFIDEIRVPHWPAGNLIFCNHHIVFQVICFDSFTVDIGNFLKAFKQPAPPPSVSLSEHPFLCFRRFFLFPKAPQVFEKNW